MSRAEKGTGSWLERQPSGEQQLPLPQGFLLGRGEGTTQATGLSTEFGRLLEPLGKVIP